VSLQFAVVFEAPADFQTATVRKELERFTIALHTVEVFAGRTPPGPPFVRGGK
jgi:hypothetical protein